MKLVDEMGTRPINDVKFYDLIEELESSIDVLARDRSVESANAAIVTLAKIINLLGEQMKLSQMKRFNFTSVSFRGISPGVHYNGTGLLVSWAAKGIGFGQMLFHFYDDGRITVDTECMPDNFVQALLKAVMKKLLEAERIG